MRSRVETLNAQAGKAALAAVALAGAAIGSGGCASGSGAVDDGYRLGILHINDHHSHLDAAELSLRAPEGARAAVPVSLGGFARVASAIEALGAGHPNLLKLHAGDAITGTLYFTLTQGRADAELMNTVCFDAMAVGNHEFDAGDAGLAHFIGQLWADPACRTPVLSANVAPRPGSPLAPGMIQPAVVVERGGERIGIVGLTAQRKTQYSSRPDRGTRLLDERASAQAAIDGLRARGVNKIVLLSHVGHARDRELAAELSGVDVVVGGDSHTLLGDAALARYGLVPAGPYPARVRNRDGELVCVVQAWQYAAVVGELDVVFDRDGRVRACSGQPHVLIGAAGAAADAAARSAADAALVAALAADPALRVTAPSPRAEAVLAPHRAARVAFGGNVVGHVGEALCMRRVPGSGRDAGRSALPGCNDDAHVRAHGGDVQQLVAEAFLRQGQRYGGAQISLQNGGGVRTDLPAGALTVDAIYTVLPFANTLVRLHMTGAEIKAALEDALDAVARGSTGAYPYAGGLRWRVDLRAARGERVSALEVRDEDGNGGDENGGDGRWSALDPAARYTVITSDYLADGQGGYGALARIGGERREATFLAYADAFLQYVIEQRTLARPARADFSTQSFIDTAPVAAP